MLAKYNQEHNLANAMQISIRWKKEWTTSFRLWQRLFWSTAFHMKAFKKSYPGKTHVLTVTPSCIDTVFYWYVSKFEDAFYIHIITASNKNTLLSMFCSVKKTLHRTERYLEMSRLGSDVPLHNTQNVYCTSIGWYSWVWQKCGGFKKEP